MLPQANIEIWEQLQKVTMPSLSYRLNFNTMRLRGKVDKLEAIKQAVYKIFQTERYKYLIYSDNYGIELEDLKGKDFDFVKSEFKRRAREALLVDDRITAVFNFNFELTDIDSCTIKFTVQSTEGEFEAEVVLNV